jgi:16S rRNA (guanine527-N7)-methyltransferase
MNPAYIADLLQPFLGKANDQRLTATDLQNISTYIDLLLRWNARINLTAVRNEDEIVTRHFGESLFTARHLYPECRRERPRSCSPDETLIDIGAGAGFPGLPIRIWAPEIKVTLIESNQKKATFLREVTRAITLTNINVFHGRAEDYLDPAETVTLRAVEHFNTILPTAARLVAPAGRLAILVGASQLTNIKSLTPGFTWSAPIQVPLSSSRVLIIGLREPWTA